MIRPRITHYVGRMTDRIDVSALHPVWHRSRSWWAIRSLREQVLIGGLAAVAIFALFLLVVIVPLRAVRQADYDSLHTIALLDARLRAGGTASGQPATMRHGTPSAILTDSAAAARLSIERIEPEGGNTRVVLGDASFDQVIRWIASVEATSRLRVEQAQIDRKGGPGIVRATFVVTG
ncbi:type II secretion system protein GspM [Novosphingobium sp.]|uniref:type II secretion system protein GspM n=1 Tax=Novosphingobium sp. TaxID=1874826 RepID=UPI003B52D79A